MKKKLVTKRVLNCVMFLSLVVASQTRSMNNQGSMAEQQLSEEDVLMMQQEQQQENQEYYDSQDANQEFMPEVMNEEEMAPQDGDYSQEQVYQEGFGQDVMPADGNLDYANQDMQYHVLDGYQEAPDAQEQEFAQVAPEELGMENNVSVSDQNVSEPSVDQVSYEQLQPATMTAPSNAECGVTNMGECAQPLRDAVVPQMQKVAHEIVQATAPVRHAIADGAVYGYQKAEPMINTATDYATHAFATATGKANDAYNAARPAMGRFRGRLKVLGNTATEKARETFTQENFNTAKEEILETAHNAGPSLKSAAHTVGETAKAAAHTIQEAGKNAGETVVKSANNTLKRFRRVF